MKPPTHISRDAAKWFVQVTSTYDLEAHHVRLLTLACEAWDRCVEARKALDNHGLTFLDRFGCPRSRPEVAIERDSRLAFARLVRELDLDCEVHATPNVTRIPSIASNRPKVAS